MRYKNLDLLKTIAMLLVVSLHAGTWHADLIGDGFSGCIEYALRILAEGVPIFVAVNGFLLLGKSEFVLRKHLKKTAHLFLLLIFWSVFLTISKALVWGKPLSASMLLSHVFSSPIIEDRYIGCLWFLQSLVALYLFVPVIKQVFDTNKQVFKYTYWVSLLLWCAAALVGYAASPISTATGNDAMSMFTKWVRDFYPASATSFVLFFMTGGMIRLHSEWLKAHRRMVSVLGAVAWIAAFAYAFAMSQFTGKTYSPSFCYSSPFMFAMLFGWFALTQGYQGRFKIVDRAVTSIGQSTLGIYLLHTLIIAILEMHFPIAKLMFPLRALILLSVFTMSWLLTLLWKKIPGANRLIQ